MNQTLNSALLYVYLLALPLVSGNVLGDQRPTLVFNCHIEADLPLANIIRTTYSQAFDRLGYDFKLVFLPSMRSLRQLQDGKLDGECGRIKELKADEQLHNILRVNTKLMNLDLVLMTYDPRLVGITKASLFESKLRIGIQLGAVSIDREIPRQDMSLNVHFSHLSHGFNMLKAGRIDLLAAPDLLSQATIEKLQIAPAPQLAANLGSFEIYPYLSITRAELAAPFAHELKLILDKPDHPLHPYRQSLTPMSPPPLR